MVGMGLKTLVPMISMLKGKFFVALSVTVQNIILDIFTVFGKIILLCRLRSHVALKRQI